MEHGRHRAPAATAACPSGGEDPHQTKSLSKVLAWATIGTTYPVGKSKAWMTVTSNSANGSKYGGAIKYSGVNASFAGTTFAEGGWGKTWNGSSVKRSYRKQIEYRWVKYYNYLAGTACDHVHWIPDKETGGNDQNTAGINWPDWRKCVKTAPGPFTRNSTRGETYDYSAAVKLREDIGVDVGISRQYSRYQAITYNVVGKKLLCGTTTGRRWQASCARGTTTASGLPDTPQRALRALAGGGRPDFVVLGLHRRARR